MDNKRPLFNFRRAPGMHSVRVRRHNQRGFSLVSVLLMATLAMTWLAASSATLLPMFRYVGGSASTIKLETAAESAAEYALAQLNDPTTRATVDPELNGVQSQAVIFPVAMVSQLNPGGALTATIARQAPPNATYDPSLPNFYGVGAQKASTLVGTPMPWRTVTATASLGLLKRTVIVVLRPTVITPTLANKGNGSTSFFPQAGFTGVDMFWLGNGSSTSAVATAGTAPLKGDSNLNIGGDVSTYGNIRLDGNSEVGGHLQVVSDGTSKGSATAVGSSVQVNQYLQLTSAVGPTSTQSGFADPSQPNANVMNDGQAASSDNTLKPTLNDPGEILAGTGNPVTSQGVPPAYASPQSAIPHGSTFNTGDTISGADYSVQSLTINSGTITAANDGSPARIFVEGNSTEAVQINGNLNATGNPENMQIWYNGTGNITFDSVAAMNVSAVIYAPNANVIFKSSTNQPVNFTGAINARTISGGVDDKGVPVVGAKNANLTFSRAIQGSPGASPNTSLSSLSYSPTDFNVSANNLRWVAASVLENPKEH